MTNTEFIIGANNMNDKNNDISTQILRKLIDKGYHTREDIAKSVGMDTSTVTKYYNGDRKLTVEAIKKFANYFEVSADYLLGLSESPSTSVEVSYFENLTGLNLSSIYTLSKMKEECTDKEFCIDLINEIVQKLSEEHYKLAEDYRQITIQLKENATEYIKYYNENSENVTNFAIEIEKNKTNFKKVEEKAELAEFKMYQLKQWFEYWINYVCRNEKNEALEKYYTASQCFRDFDNKCMTTLIQQKVAEIEGDELNGNDN